MVDVLANDLVSTPQSKLAKRVGLVLRVLVNR